MTTTQIIIALAVLALIIGVILAAGEGGPRITQITRTRRKDDDEPKDGPDA
jgi:hypothetical protein